MKKEEPEKNTVLPNHVLRHNSLRGSLPWHVLLWPKHVPNAEDPAPEDEADDELLEQVWAKDDPYAIHPGLIILAK